MRYAQGLTRPKNSALLNLHKQFGQAPEEKLKALMEDAGNWQGDFEEDPQFACQKCQCNVSKPMSMPLVSPQNFKFGNTVYFRRDGQVTCMGQAKVMFQHGNTVFVRQSSICAGIFEHISNR